jgi:hypothetical protein
VSWMLEAIEEKALQRALNKLRGEQCVTFFGASSAHIGTLMIFAEKTLGVPPQYYEPDELLKKLQERLK